MLCNLSDMKLGETNGGWDGWNGLSFLFWLKEAVMHVEIS
jgi:hypothetical protein